MQAIPKWYELLCYVGGLLDREGLFVEMLLIINCEISYSGAKIGLVSRSCLGEDLMFNPKREMPGTV